MTQEFGHTAWGADWRRLAEPTYLSAPDPRLPKARSLTRRNGVENLIAEPGQISATVAGTGEHQILIELPVWTVAQQRKATRLVTSSATNDDLGDPIHTALGKAGLPPLPALSQMTATCSCLQRTRLCVHLLATCYEMARRCDERPRMALMLRGLAEIVAPTNVSRIPISMIDPRTFYTSRIC